MADENNITTLAKRLRPFIKLAAQEMVPITPYDHGNLSGLADDDHAQYVHLTQARTITAVHTFDPTSSTAPFIVAADGQGQTVLGLKADQLSKSVVAGSGLTGGGELSADRTLTVGAGNGIQVGTDDVAVKLPTYSGLTADGTGLYIADTIAGNGLSISNKILAVGAGDGITVAADTVGLTTPGTLSVSSSNNASGSHTHAITTSANPGAAQSILASTAAGLLSLLMLDVDNIGDRSGGNLMLEPAGDIILNPAGYDVLPDDNYAVNVGALNKKYLTLHAAELWVETLVAADVMATIGGRILVAPTTVLVADVAPADTTIYVKHNQMAVGDRVYLEADGKVEWMAITSGPTASGPYWSHGVTRNLDGSGANQWYAGDAVLNTGTTGDGYIDIYSVDSIRSGVHYGPTVVGNIRTGTTYSNLIEAWAIGNLNGIYGYGVDTYGAGFGKYANSSSFLTIDPTNGIRMIYKNGLGAEAILAQWAVSGVLTIGEVGASKDNIYISAGDLSIRNNTTDRIALTSAGVLTIKDSGGAAVFTLDSAAGAEFTKPLTLATTGGIYQGSGTFASPTTGLKIYNSGGYGKISGYNAGVEQWYGNTDGKLYAGAGYVWLDATGITMKRATLFQYGLRWVNSSGTVRTWVDSNDGSFSIDHRSDDGTRLATFDITNTSGGTRTISFSSGSGAFFCFDNSGAGSGGRGNSYFTYSDLRIDGGLHIGSDTGTCYDNDVIVDGGVSVGRTFDVGAGNIEFTGVLISYKNSTEYTGYIFVPLATPATSTSYDGDVVNVGTYSIDTSALFGIPAGVKAVSVFFAASWTTASSTSTASLSSKGSTVAQVQARSMVSAYLTAVAGIVACDANGDIDLIVAGANTTAVHIRITGYWI